MNQVITKIIIPILLFQGCLFYSTRGSLPVHINSISLAPVVNESAEFSAAEILNEELNELMVNENVLDIVLPEQADSRLEVVILSVTDKPYTVTDKITTSSRLSACSGSTMSNTFSLTMSSFNSSFKISAAENSADSFTTGAKEILLICTGKEPLVE
jgi:hypothetical protein